MTFVGGALDGVVWKTGFVPETVTLVSVDGDIACYERDDSGRELRHCQRAVDEFEEAILEGMNDVGDERGFDPDVDDPAEWEYFEDE